MRGAGSIAIWTPRRQNNISSRFEFKGVSISLQGKDDAAQLRFARRWVNCHVDAAADIGKPVVLAEFGKKGCGPARAEFFQKVHLLPRLVKAMFRGVGFSRAHIVAHSLPTTSAPLIPTAHLTASSLTAPSDKCMSCPGVDDAVR